MSQVSGHPTGFLSFTFHAHLPYVVNHGTWPHGIEWLHEAAAETYLPFLRMLRGLERDGVPFRCNLNLSPVLLEQLSHPLFLAEFPRYLDRKIMAATEDEAFFLQSGESHYAELARFWSRFFIEALADFRALDDRIVSGFQHFHQTGLITLITSAATHGYLPLLGTDESVRAQVRTGVATFQRHFGEHPAGVWSPECGYRPAGSWSYPTSLGEGTPVPPAFDRVGLEQVFSELKLGFFIVDTHLVEESSATRSPYRLPSGVHSTLSLPAERSTESNRNLYQPWLVHSPPPASPPQPPVSVFPRDPRTGVQVWSGDTGYPGEAAYLDFHKKRWPGGHRYWSVTGSDVDTANKQPYFPNAANAKVREHATHFTHIVWETLNSAPRSAGPPILCAPFDVELFGHWWFEGIAWLDAVARNLHTYDTGIALASAPEFLARFPPAGTISMHEGSWGAEGASAVWLNPETTWTWTHIYAAELYVRDLATSGKWRASPLATRVAQQICRELLLLESSDWQFLITTGAARDYAEARFMTHVDQFNALKSIWFELESASELSPEHLSRLDEICARDSLFPDIDPADWAAPPPTPAPAA